MDIEIIIGCDLHPQQVADAATTLWMAIMLRAAAPIDCAATIVAPLTPSACATLY